MMLTKTELDNIGDDLVAGVSQNNKKRKQRYAMGIVPIVGALAGLGAVVTGGNDTPAYALAERPDGTIEVEIFPNFDDADELQAELADAGLDATVVQLRAHPSLDGVAEVVSHDNEGTEALEFRESRFTIDVGEANGLFEILLYTAAGSDEDYQAAPSLFAPEQALSGMHCAYSDRPLPTEDVEKALVEAGLDNVEWTVFGDTDPETGEIFTQDHDQRPEGVVTNAELRNETTVCVGVEEEAGAAADAIVMHDGTHYRERPECTVDLAAPWE